MSQVYLIYQKVKKNYTLGDKRATTKQKQTKLIVNIKTLIIYFYFVELTIGKACSVNSDCKETDGLCKRGRCYCSRFYRYDANSRDCIKGIASVICILV
jgi:hypothetical protein